MRNIFNYISIILGVVMISSCGKDFLDKEPTSFLTEDQLKRAAENNSKISLGSMLGVYTTMFLPRGVVMPTSRDFGQKSIDIYSDMISSDMALSKSRSKMYNDIASYNSTIDFTDNLNYQVWRYYYKIIRSTNEIIESLGGNDEVPKDKVNKDVMGQAKAMRADSYFYLTQYFQSSFDLNEEILPIYTKLSDKNGPKVAASKIYELIVKDLTTAITLLADYERPDKYAVNVDVAKGILSYVYAAMGDYEKVEKLTDELVSKHGSKILKKAEVITSGFNNVSTPGWMWGVDIQETHGLDLFSFWAQIDVYSYSYAAYGDIKSIDKGLYDKIKSDDKRKQQFDLYSNIIPPYRDNPNHLVPSRKFFDKDRIPGGGGNQITDSDYVYMRISEMVLLSAEALAKNSKESEAKERLKLLLKERMDDYSYIDALSGEALLDEIYLQTRIELWGEGKVYLALKRNKKPAVRGENHLFSSGASIPYNDKRMFFKIPEIEIINNTFIDSQNK